MTKRDFLRALAATPALALPAGSLAAGMEPLVVYDGRHAAARSFGIGAGIRFDCARDAGQLWRRVISPRLSTQSVITGMTCAADLMILADFARDDGLRLRARRAQRSAFVTWLIA